MSDRDNITLPREVVEEAAESLEWADSQVGGDDCYEDAAKALRTALAAPEPEPVARPWWCACKEIDAAMEDKT